MSFKKAGILIASALVISIPFTAAITAKETPLNSSPLAFKQDPATSKVRMLTGRSGAIPLQKQAGETVADSVKRQFARHFGIQNPATELAVKRDYFPSVSRQNIRYQQLHQGLPVIGGELVANLDSQQQLTSLSGETAQVTLDHVFPRISAEQAQTTAMAAVSKWHDVDYTKLTTSDPKLSVYDPSLVGPGTGPQRLVWQMSVTPTELAPINEYILVDAERNAIALHFNKIHSLLNRETYTASNLVVLPGTLVCNEADPTCAAGDTDAQLAHQYAADTYNFYFNNHGRDSIDGNGMTLISTTHYGPPNDVSAFWNGTQMVLSDGFPVGDDVVAHELTHGVTNSTSNLFYYYQSGAINESLSDVWGEFVDLTNTGGIDNPSVRWQMGEGIPIGVVRDMSDPTAFSDPDRMTSGFYHTGTSDYGGVHTNSGVNNKAVYLMVDGSAGEPGGVFNGQTITGIGISKVATIYYDVQTNFLLTASDYLDLYNALNQSCQNLIGTNGITSDDCIQVNNALLAVEMNQQPVADFNPDAEVCAPGSIIDTSLFYDDFESLLSNNWTPTNLIGTGHQWAILLNYATSGTRGAFSIGAGEITDSVLELNNQVAIPNDGNTYYLHFNHFFEFDYGTYNYDGGVIEYSTDSTTWNDALSLPGTHTGRSYNGTINDPLADNPLTGRQAFTALSHGYNSTRLDLSSLAGQSVRFRFRHAEDSSLGSVWGIDDFRVYSCVTNAAPTANAGTDQTVLANASVTLSGSGNDPDSDPITYQWTQTAGTNVALSGATTRTPSFTAPGVSSTLVFQLRVTDSNGQYSNDSVSVVVDGPPTANAGSDQTVNIDAAVTLNGSGSNDVEGAITYSWAQAGGTGVSLTGADTAMPTFTAPSAPTTLTFLLTVTDSQNQTAIDTVSVTVQNTPAPGGGGGGCSVSDNGRFDPLWLLLLMFFAGLHLVNQQRRENTK